MIILRFLVGALIGIYSVIYIAEYDIARFLKVLFVYTIAILLGIV